jgi:hypothetical protein
MTLKPVDAHKDDFVFVLGNTRHIKDMSEKELAVLHKNGDTRVKPDNSGTTEAKSLPAKPAVIEAAKA